MDDWGYPYFRNPPDDIDKHQPRSSNCWAPQTWFSAAIRSASRRWDSPCRPRMAPWKGMKVREHPKNGGNMVEKKETITIRITIMAIMTIVIIMIIMIFMIIMMIMMIMIIMIIMMIMMIIMMMMMMMIMMIMMIIMMMMMRKMIVLLTTEMVESIAFTT